MERGEGSREPMTDEEFKRKHREGLERRLANPINDYERQLAQDALDSLDREESEAEDEDE